jgi:hypothetical protein
VNAKVGRDVLAALVEDVLALGERAAVRPDVRADRAYRAALVDDERALAGVEGVLGARAVAGGEEILVAVEDVDPGGPWSGAQTTIALTSGAGSLTIAAAGDVCFPGNSQNAPGQLHAFGNPFSIAASFDVIGGTGVFAGAGGGGTATLKGAGAQYKLTASGVLEL